MGVTVDNGVEFTSSPRERGMGTRSVPIEGCGDSKEFAFCGSVSAEPRLKGRFTLASPPI
jgi:hypothetical protein